MDDEDGFYLTLPSNASLGEYPENSIGDYKTLLPHPISLAGSKFKCALVELIYPKTFINVHKPETVFRVLYNSDTSDPTKKPDEYTVTIPSGFYASELQFIRALNDEWIAARDMPNEHPTPVKFAYNVASRKCSISLNAKKPNTEVKINLPDALSEILGFPGGQILVAPKMVMGTPPKKIVTTSSYIGVNIHRTLHTMFVYCNIINHVPVGDIMAPLLRIVNIEGQEGETVSQTYNRPYYVPVSVDELSTVHISIRSSLGEKINFQGGSATAVLHFKRV
jgi:hypothetical protein